MKIKCLFIGLIIANVVTSGCVNNSIEKKLADINYIDQAVKSTVIEKYECDGNVLTVIAELNKMIDDRRLPKEYRRGIKVVCTNLGIKANPYSTRVRINMTNVSVFEVLNEIRKQAGLHMRFEKRTVYLY